MLYSEIDTGSFCPCWGEKEQTVSRCVSLTIGTVASQNSGTSTSVGNPVSCAQATDNGNMSSILIG